MQSGKLKRYAVVSMVGALGIFCALGSQAQQGRAASSEFLVRNARVFDGQKTESIEVWVRDGKIYGVGKNLKAPAGIRVVDGTGDTLLPGLIDSHTHAWRDALEQALMFGVTTELDMFSEVKFGQQMRSEQTAGKATDRADLFSAGTLVTAPGGHGTEYGIPIPTISRPEEAQAFVDARIAEGSDYIKLVYDDASAYGSHRPTLSKETMKAVSDAAHKRGKLAVVHIGSQQQARDAIDAGADGLVHLFEDVEPAPDFAKEAAAHHVFIIPTLAVLESVGGDAGGAALAADPRLSPYLTSENLANLKKSFPKFSTGLSEKYAETAVRELKALKVPMLAGTDAPNPGTAHGASLHRELELLVRAGLTPEEALAAATSVPAATFHLSDRGSIAAGKRADLLLVKGDPTKDITATRDIVAVWKQGVEADRQSDRAKIEKEKQASEQARNSAAPSGSEVGLISDFEDGKASVKFGAGWSVSTDDIAGGKSTGSINVVVGGANGSKQALAVAGEIAPGLPFAWAGAMFSPGPQPFMPVNLSAKKALTFWVKGDGKTYRAMFFTQSGGRMPAVQTFVAGAEWQKVSLPFSGFNGTDGYDINAILLVGGPTAGKFDFQVDDVKLE